jgi:hypothetical protein
MSDNKNPVAWYVAGDGYEYSTLLEEHARAVAEEEDGTVTPLYRLPTLTDEERDVLGRVADDAGYRAMEGTERVVRRLLDRLG